MKVRFIILIFSVILSIAYAVSIGKIFLTLFEVGLSRRLIAFVIGNVLFLTTLIFFFDFWKNWMGFFTHELTHALTCVLTFQTLLHFSVNRGQKSQVVCKRPSTFVILSPYFLPIFSFIPIVSIPFLQERYIFYLFVVIGFTTMYHLVTFITQCRPFQTDLQQVGFISSAIYIAFGNIFFLGLVFALVTGNFQGMWSFAGSGFHQIINWIDIILIY